MFVIGILFLIISICILIRPDILWPLQEFSNAARGIPNTKPTDAFRMLTSMQAVFGICISIFLITFGFPEVQESYNRSSFYSAISNLKFVADDLSLSITNTSSESVDLVLSSCLDLNSTFRQGVTSDIQVFNYSGNISSNQTVTVPIKREGSEVCILGDENGRNTSGKCPIFWGPALYCDSVQVNGKLYDIKDAGINLRQP